MELTNAAGVSPSQMPSRRSLWAKFCLGFRRSVTLGIARPLWASRQREYKPPSLTGARVRGRGRRLVADVSPRRRARGVRPPRGRAAVRLDARRPGEGCRLVGRQPARNLDCAEEWVRLVGGRRLAFPKEPIDNGAPKARGWQITRTSRTQKRRQRGDVRQLVAAVWEIPDAAAAGWVRR